MLTLHRELRKTCHPSTKNKYFKVQGDSSSCNLAKGERVIKKEYMLKKHRKNVLQSKSIEKRRKSEA
jgi:hypothetical protein